MRAPALVCTVGFDVGEILNGNSELQVEWIGSTSDVPEDPQADSRTRERRATQRRWQLIAALVVAILGAAGTGVWYSTRPEPALVFTVAGRSVVSPTELIKSADSVFLNYVHGRHGVTTARSRCYFNRSSDTSKTDIGVDVFCGPVLFHAGSPSAPYLRFGLPETPGGAPQGQVLLSVARSPESTAPSALPAGIHLMRPDRRRPPSGADGLTPPPPPPAATMVIATVDRADLPRLPVIPSTAMIGSRYITVRLLASGQVSSFGRGNEARVAPPGEVLRAFELDISDGEDVLASADLLPALGLSIDGHAPRPVPWNYDATTSTEFLFVATALPKTARTLDLVVTDAGVTQRLSILTGVPAAGDISVLRRSVESRTQITPSKQVVLPATVSGNGQNQQVQLTVDLNDAYLGYFSSYGGNNQHASGPDRALLAVSICYRSPQIRGQDDQLNAFRCFDAANFSVTPTRGSPIRAQEYGRGFVGVDVPASFTSGLVTFTGPEDLGHGQTLHLSRPISFHLAFPS